MLEVCDVGYDYSDKPVLAHIQFSLSPGQMLYLRGGNGAGKTTLLKLLAGLLYPAYGKIVYQGLPIQANLSAYQQKLCYVGHKSGVSAHLTVWENCYFDVHYGQSTMVGPALLQGFSLTSLKDVMTGFLSEGLRRKTGLSRLLISNVPLWLLDEPLTALDDAATAYLVTVLNQHCEQGGSVVLTSHQPLPPSLMAVETYQL